MRSILISKHSEFESRKLYTYIYISMLWNLASYSQYIFLCIGKFTVTKVAKEKTELPPYLYSSLFIVMNIIYLHSFNEHK